MPEPTGRPQALLVDWGGVLTSPLSDVMGAWCESDGIDFGGFSRVMRELLTDPPGPDSPRTDPPDGHPPDAHPPDAHPPDATAAGIERQVAANPIHALERGEMAVADFERALATRLRTQDGRPVVVEGLLGRMFAGFHRDPGMVAVVRRARAAGVKTGLLSNSWGLDYPREDWAELFDTVVISGEVQMRKPDPEIYRYAAQQLGLPPTACVFVDDLRPNVRGAAAVGMVGVHHLSLERTVAELETLFGLPLGG